MQSLSLSDTGRKLSPEFLDYIDTLCGICGALMLASNIWLSAYGYILFLLSSIFLLAWAIATRFDNQIPMQGIFLMINMTGLYNWLIAR